MIRSVSDGESSRTGAGAPVIRTLPVPALGPRRRRRSLVVDEQAEAPEDQHHGDRGQQWEATTGRHRRRHHTATAKPTRPATVGPVIVVPQHQAAAATPHTPRRKAVAARLGRAIAPRWPVSTAAVAATRRSEPRQTATSAAAARTASGSRVDAGRDGHQQPERRRHDRFTAAA